MIRHIDGDIIAAQIRFLRQVHKGAILMVEGETDAKVFDRFIDKKNCTTEVCFGKRHLLHALDLLEEQGFPGVLAIVDADFDPMLGISHKLENLYLTDHHDLDLTIFLSAALVTYLGEHADKSLFKSEFGSDPDLVRGAIFKACETLAYCRLVSERHQLKLDFKDLRLDQFIDERNLDVNTDALLSEILARSRCSRTIAELRALIHLECANAYAHEKVVCGHDAADVLGISLRKIIANRKPQQTWGSEIEAGLRLAFDWVAFGASPCIADIHDWEARNTAYRILPA